MSGGGDSPLPGWIAGDGGVGLSRSNCCQGGSTRASGPKHRIGKDAQHQGCGNAQQQRCQQRDPATAPYRWEFSPHFTGLYPFRLEHLAEGRLPRRLALSLCASVSMKTSSAFARATSILQIPARRPISATCRERISRIAATARIRLGPSSSVESQGRAARRWKRLLVKYSG